MRSSGVSSPAFFLARARFHGVPDMIDALRGREFEPGRARELGREPAGEAARDSESLLGPLAPAPISWGWIHSRDRLRKFLA